ncbi:restriction endonuclease [Streptoverticillium reticulum]|uniref:restriction endonuclease n=1 Tax=Streptoverticillium reticulum TaxID=1433415 RepID=UPI0039BFC07E
MTRRRLRIRPGLPRTGTETTAALVALVFLAFIVRRTARIVADSGWYAWLSVFLCVGCYVLVMAVRRARRRATDRERAARLGRLRLPLPVIDALTPTEFELAVRDLMIRDGIAARHVGRQGDQAADVIGNDPAGRVIVAQCKHTAHGGRVGSHVLYEVKGTATPVHGADVAVVVTNGGLTRDAREWGDRYGVHWIDRERLRTWAEQGSSLQEVLKAAHPF